MKPAAFVVDTNVLVAGLLARDAASPVARVLDGMLAAAFPFAMSEALLAEYRAVLARPPIRARHGLDDEGIDLLLTELVRHAIVLEPGRGAAAPDPGDQLLWDLLASRADLVLVTGDRALLEDATMAGRVMSPVAFLSR
ncbi:MAG: putative toxin-antitoxin system toxin component, PIN family [Burkholderiales bacterium]|nr:PIN domain-containing protein [Burkholderiales bacterium]MCZ8100215.1 PIN domain-containing protein [Burkholderiales bacterium]